MEAGSHTQPGVEDALPQGGWGPFELGCREYPVDILCGRPHPVHREFGLIGLVSEDLLLGFPSRGKAPNEEFGQHGL